MEELGWGDKNDREEDANGSEPPADDRPSELPADDRPADEPTSEAEDASELQYESAESVTHELSTHSDHSSVSTPQHNQVLPEQLSLSGLSLPSSDPAKWKELTRADTEVIVLNGPPQIPLSLP